MSVRRSRPAANARSSHRRLPRDRSRVHAAAALAVAGVALAIATLSALPHTVTVIEKTLFDAINGLPNALEWPLWVVMQLGAVLAIPAIALATVLVWRRVRPPLDVLVAGGLAWVLARVMKNLIERGRPASFFDTVNLRGSVGAANHEGLGFPSGHATVAFAVAAVLYPYLAPRWRVVTLLLAGVVGFARIYFGAHLPLDVLGGAALGVAIGACVHLGLDLVTRRD